MTSMRKNKTLFVLVSALSLASTALGMDPLPPTPPVPADNPMSPAKVTLGRQLFHDPRLSRTGNVSCASCHNVMAGGEDNRPNSVGVEGKTGGRSAPTVWNAAFLSVQFWDGRAASLEEQAKGPLINPIEMGMPDHKSVMERVASIPGYREQFTKVFGVKDPLTIGNLAKAIAAYERTLLTPNSPVDRFLKGDKKALSPSAQRGMQLATSVGCTTCHSGPNFAGPPLPAGQGFFMRFPTFPGSEYERKYDLTDDKGRHEVTRKDEDKHLFRVPTWRNVAVTAPYFHNGSVKTLDEAVRVMAKTQLNKTLGDQEVADLVAFLEDLTGEFPKQEMPRLPPTPGRALVN